MEIAISLAILVLSIILHEVAHGYAADSLGDPTARLSNRLTLNPIPHIDAVGSILIPALLVFSQSPIFFGWAKPVPYNPYNLRNQRWGEMWVALAGSATNLFIALLFCLIIRYGGVLGLDAAALLLAAQIALMNLFLGLFNLIPLPPLDGFTALRSGLPWHLSSSLSRFEESIRTGGVVSLILILLVFSYFFAQPFAELVLRLFSFLSGIGI